MGILENKIALIAGGTGEIGEGIVEAFLEEGATVVVPSRSKDRIQLLRKRVTSPDRLITFEDDIGSAGGAEEIRDRIQHDAGRIDAVVASLGGLHAGPALVQVTQEEWQQALADSLTSHFIVARTFLPLLARGHGSSYTFINGPAAVNPVPGAGPLSVTASAQLMLKNALVVEHRKSGVRINTVVINAPLRTRSRIHANPAWLTADEVGHYIAYLASPLSSQVRGETIELRNRVQLAALAA